MLCPRSWQVHRGTQQGAGPARRRAGESERGNESSDPGQRPHEPGGGGAGWSGPSSQMQAERDPPLPGHFPLRVSRADPVVGTGSHGGHGRGTFLPPSESPPSDAGSASPDSGSLVPVFARSSHLPSSLALCPPPPGLGTLSWRTKGCFLLPLTAKTRGVPGETRVRSGARERPASTGHFRAS